MQNQACVRVMLANRDGFPVLGFRVEGLGFTLTRNDTGGSFTGSGVQRIGYYADEDSWQQDGNNYHCNACGRQF
eukprot:2246693-Pyramimonas_sp.AAC.1